MTHLSKKHRWSSIALAIGVAAGASGCGGSAQSTAKAGAASVQQASTSSPKNTAQDLIFYSAGPKSLASGLAKAFEKQTGIHVELFQSTTGKVLGRLQAEKNNPKADVVALADWSAGDALDHQGLLLTFHPANQKQLIWTGAGSTYFGYSASALGITYNKRLVPNPPKTWADVLNPQWKNKVVMPDPAQSGSAVDLVGGYLQNHKNSWSYFEALQKNGAVVQGANAVALGEVLSGSKDMVLGGVDYMAYKDIAKGNPIGIVYPQDGTVVNPRPVMILKSSPHVKLAEQFVNFILSPAGQKIVAGQYLLPGVKGFPVNPHRAGLGQIHSMTVNWSQLAGHKANIVQRVDNLLG